jgi:DNA-binding response OmpR family regulator
LPAHLARPLLFTLATMVHRVNFVKDRFKILITDRNRHVREFLRRELSAEGYQVEVAKDGREVLTWINGNDPPDLLILDLEIPYVDELEVLARLQDHQPPLPVVIHTFLPESVEHPTGPKAEAFLEKKGDTDFLKAIVGEVICKYYPERAAGASGGEPKKENQA